MAENHQKKVKAKKEKRKKSIEKIKFINCMQHVVIINKTVIYNLKQKKEQKIKKCNENAMK